jgi:membrane fusion protein, heavy metal efflux system
MIRAMIRYLIFFLVAGTIVYAGYRMLAPATTKTVATEKSEKEEHSDGVAMSEAKVAAAEIELAKAAPAVLHDSLRLNGMVQANQESLIQITPRFPGVVREVRKRIGDHVEKGDILATVESNQSLTPYELKAAFAGTIIDRQTTLGEYVSEQKPAFVIADLSTVWVDFSVYRRDLGRVRVGDQILIDPADGGPKIEAKISYVSPVGSSETQSALARAVVANGLRPTPCRNPRRTTTSC